MEIINEDSPSANHVIQLGFKADLLSCNEKSELCLISKLVLNFLIPLFKQLNTLEFPISPTFVPETTAGHWLAIRKTEEGLNEKVFNLLIDDNREAEANFRILAFSLSVKPLLD